MWGNVLVPVVVYISGVQRAPQNAKVESKMGVAAVLLYLIHVWVLILFIICDMSTAQSIKSMIFGKQQVCLKEKPLCQTPSAYKLENMLRQYKN